MQHVQHVVAIVSWQCPAHMHYCQLTTPVYNM